MDEARSKLFPIIPLILTAVIVAGLIRDFRGGGSSRNRLQRLSRLRAWRSARHRPTSISRERARAAKVNGQL